MIAEAAARNPTDRFSDSVSGNRKRKGRSKEKKKNVQRSVKYLRIKYSIRKKKKEEKKRGKRIRREKRKDKKKRGEKREKQ